MNNLLDSLTSLSSAELVELEKEVSKRITKKQIAYLLTEKNPAVLRRLDQEVSTLLNKGGGAKQIHGFNYERATIEKTGSTNISGYTHKYDCITNGKFHQIKAIKKGGAVDLGDIFRNATKGEDFYLTVGFWEGKSHNIVEEYTLLIKHRTWNRLLKFSGYEKMKTWIKSVSNDRSYDDQWKQEVENWKSIWNKEEKKRWIHPRFKRDHKKQKRIQCSIKNADFFGFFMDLFEVVELSPV